jgi:hypothetical protein
MKRRATKQKKYFGAKIEQALSVVKLNQENKAEPWSRKRGTKPHGQQNGLGIQPHTEIW